MAESRAVEASAVATFGQALPYVGLSDITSNPRMQVQACQGVVGPKDVSSSRVQPQYSHTRLLRGYAADRFVRWMEDDDFLTWEAVMGEEQGVRLTARQKEVLGDLLSFNRDEDNDQILYKESPLPRHWRNP